MRVLLARTYGTLGTGHSPSNARHGAHEAHGKHTRSDWTDVPRGKSHRASCLCKAVDVASHTRSNDAPGNDGAEEPISAFMLHLVVYPPITWVLYDNGKALRRNPSTDGRDSQRLELLEGTVGSRLPYQRFQGRVISNQKATSGYM